MRSPVETLRFEGGPFAEIHRDPDVEQPFACDNAVHAITSPPAIGRPDAFMIPPNLALRRIQ